MQILIHVNRTLNAVFIVVNLLMEVIFILGHYKMQSSKEAFWTFITMQCKLSFVVQVTTVVL